MKAPWFLCVLAFLVAALVITAGFAQRPEPANSRNALLVKELMLTDLAIWTEARYTRHPSQADLFTALQDGPGALEHFPAGTWVAPAGLRQAITLPPGARPEEGDNR